MSEEEIKELIEQLEYKEFYRYYEEKNKLIKDLQQKVEQLEKENILLKEANNYHQEVIKSMKEPENAHHYHLENIKLRAINNQLENIRKEAIGYINHEIFKRTILVGVGTKKYTRNILDNILNILNKGE